MKIHFHLAEERFDELTLGAQIAMQEHQQGRTANIRGMVEMMVPFMQDEAGNWLDHDKAFGLLESIKHKELEGVIEQFSLAMEEYAVPKENGNSSISPSTTAEKAQDGSST